MKIDWKDTEVLILGGTGSLGNALVDLLTSMYFPKGIRIYSRDEYKQFVMRKKYSKEYFKDRIKVPIAYLVGDVRDRDRLSRAMNRADVVINCAAMKQVPACEDNPFEAVKTNIYGAQNIIDCAIDNKVRLVMHVSTDKAVYPVNLYGGTKLVAEKMFIHGNVYTGGHGTTFSCCRYGNVIGSRGSIIPLFLEQRQKGRITITDPRMTRFWITLQDVARFIIRSIDETEGKDIFIPTMPSVRIMDLAHLIAPTTEIECIGIRRGEKLHETLMTWEESKNVEIYGRGLRINQEYSPPEEQKQFSYISASNVMLQGDRLKELLKPYLEKEEGI